MTAIRKGRRYDSQMKLDLRSISFVVIAASALALTGSLVATSANAVGVGSEHRAVCGTPEPDSMRCHSQVIVGSDHVTPSTSTSPSGLSPAQIKSVYGFSTSSTSGSGKTIAIVDAYDDPKAEVDLGVFAAQYGLPGCTTANGCFTKVDQTGGTSYPRMNSGWSLEISLDIQWAHAIAPGAKILLVEAKSASSNDLFAAEDYASAHATYVSNSWGGSESSSEAGWDSHFTTAGVSYFVSSGDVGLPAQYPSSSPNVISVGGTTLTFNANGSLNSETGWSSGGGGCSVYESATSAQSAFESLCGTKRATPDVSLDADPASGVSVYDSVRYSGQAGWFVVGGTSASSPMWAARSADTGAQVNAAYVYAKNISYRDITAGGNTGGCLVGYDLCSGRGSWTGATP
jgi:subtilase family serine protease